MGRKLLFYLSPTLRRFSFYYVFPGYAEIKRDAGLLCFSLCSSSKALFVTALFFCFAEFFDGIVVVGGGIGDGWGVAGAIAAGADLVYLGTRFIATHESLAQPAYKQMLVDSTADDLLVSAGLTGTPAIWLKPSLRANGLDPDNMPAAPTRSPMSEVTANSSSWSTTSNPSATSPRRS